MFPNASPLRDARRTASTLRIATEAWQHSAASWFDGTLPSVDTRLASCDQLIHRLRQAGPDHFTACAELQQERKVLADLRHSMINAHQDRDISKNVTLANVPDKLLIKARAFVRENIGVAHVPTEMRDRAHHYWASTRGGDMASRIFAQACVDVAATVPKSPAPARTAATVPDFEDHHLFL